MYQVRKKIFIEDKESLVFLVTEPISNQYWENIWESQDLHELHRNPRSRVIENITSKYLPIRNEIILEAGCGNGQFVRLLTNMGYKCLGIDYAEQTVSQLNEFFPELEIYARDVRDTRFNDELFDGYWSVGVIEHSIDSFDKIVNEAFRILKCNGYAFISFPYMSPLRNIKKVVKLYAKKECIDAYCKSHFNQYALKKEKVIDSFESKGFKFVDSIRINGLLGWIEEIALLGSFMKRVYESKNKFVKLPRFILNRILSMIMSHSILLVFKKEI